MLDGKDGNDSLPGLAGADIFAFTTAVGAGNVDTILDFGDGDDKIALDDAVFAGVGTPGSFNANAFVVGTGGAGCRRPHHLQCTTGQLYYDADGNGAGAAVLFAKVAGSPVLSASRLHGDLTNRLSRRDRAPPQGGALFRGNTNT